MVMDSQTQNELALIRDGILQTIPAEVIYLFGSHAYGTPNEDSDFDIYVVVSDDTDNISELYGELRVKLKKIRPMDLLIGKSSIFNHRKYGPTIEKVIAQRGIVLYGA